MGIKGNAHKATVNRLARRYDAEINEEDGQPDLAGDGFIIEVETSATLRQGFRRLREAEGPVFVAVTNCETLADALRMAARTNVGVMDAKGEILKQSNPALQLLAPSDVAGS